MSFWIVPDERTCDPESRSFCASFSLINTFGFILK